MISIKNIIQLNKKLISSALAFIIVCSNPMKASAEEEKNVIDFENGGFTGFASVRTVDGGDDSLLYVTEFNGSRMLKVDVTDPSKPAKVEFDVSKLVSVFDLERIRTVEMEIVIENKDGSDNVIGGASGAVATHGTAWGQTNWRFTEFNRSTSDSIIVKRKFYTANEYFSHSSGEPVIILFRRACSVNYNMYVDNIRFYDENGQPVRINDIPAEELFVPERPVKPEPQMEAHAEDITDQLTEEPSDNTGDADKPQQTTPTRTQEYDPNGNKTAESAPTGNEAAIAYATTAVVSLYWAALSARKNNRRKQREI